jgi:hypothetical protein
MKKNPSLFMTKLSAAGDAVRGNRAALLFRKGKTAQDALIRELENKIDTLQMEEESMSDFGPKSSYDLTVGSDKNMENWVARYHDIQVALFMLRRELKIAKKVMEVWFTGEDPEVTNTVVINTEED